MKRLEVEGVTRLEPARPDTGKRVVCPDNQLQAYGVADSVFFLLEKMSMLRRLRTVCVISKFRFPLSFVIRS
jgi:hypothetical protein